MDKIIRYQQLTKQYLTEFANLMNSQPVPNLETVLSFDDEHQQYLLLKVGWTEQHRTRHILLHIALKNGKIWIEEDWTEEGIASFFLEQGVPHDDIVLGFQPPEMRPYTEFAVA